MIKYVGWEKSIREGAEYVDELKRPVPFEEWPDYFTPQELVELTAGIIGRPTAYRIAEVAGFTLGKRNWGVSKLEFLKWFLGDKNPYVQQLKAKEAEWTAWEFDPKEPHFYITRKVEEDAEE